MSVDSAGHKGPATPPVPTLPSGFVVLGVNGQALHAKVYKSGFVSDFRLSLQVGNSTASVKFSQLDDLVGAIRANYSQMPGYKQHNFVGTTSLSVFGGEVDSVRYVALLCGGQTVRLDAGGVETFLLEVAHLRANVGKFDRTCRGNPAPALTGGS
jgi:hypothetical protein